MATLFGLYGGGATAFVWPEGDFGHPVGQFESGQTNPMTMGWFCHPQKTKREKKIIIIKKFNLALGGGRTTTIYHLEPLSKKVQGLSLGFILLAQFFF